MLDRPLSTRIEDLLRLAVALSFYADPANHESDGAHPSSVARDAGERARSVLWRIQSPATTTVSTTEPE